MPARSHSVGGSLSPSRAICPQIQIGKPTLPEHGAIASQAGDGDCERLLQTSKTGEGRAPVRSAELEPGDGGIAAVPADDLPGEGVDRGRPGDSQLITSRPNNAEGIPTRACGAPSGRAGSAWMPVTAGCWLSAHADASDPSDDPSPREPVRSLEQRSGKRLVVVRTDGGLAVIDRSGNVLARFARCCASNPAWSPDRERIAFVDSDVLWIVNADGTGLRQLTSD